MIYPSWIVLTENKEIKAYESELRKYPHLRSPEFLKIIAKRWGIKVGKKFVESFKLIRKIN